MRRGQEAQQQEEEEEEEEVVVLCHNCGINPAVLVCVDCGRHGQHTEYSRKQAQEAWGHSHVPYGFCRSCDIFLHQFVMKGHKCRFVLDLLPNDRFQEESRALKGRLAKEPQDMEEPANVEALFAPSWQGTAESHPLGIGFPRDPFYENGLVMTGYTLDSRGGDWKLYERHFLQELENMAVEALEAEMEEAHEEESFHRQHNSGIRSSMEGLSLSRSGQQGTSGRSSQNSSAGSSPRIPSSRSSLPPSPAGPNASPRVKEASKSRQQVHQESSNSMFYSDSSPSKRPPLQHHILPTNPQRLSSAFPPPLPAKGTPEYGVKMQGPITKSNWVVPGHVLMGSFPADDFDDLKELLAAGVRVFVCLSADVEIDDEFPIFARPPPSKNFQSVRPLPRAAYIADAQDVVSEHCGLEEMSLVRLVHLPIYEGDTADNKTLMACAQEVAAYVYAGRVAYIHGIHGHGRSAVMSALLLGIFYGISPTEALNRIKDYHSVRPDVKQEEADAPSTHEQKMQVYQIMQARDFAGLRSAAQERARALLQDLRRHEGHHSTPGAMGVPPLNLSLATNPKVVAPRQRDPVPESPPRSHGKPPHHLQQHQGEVEPSVVPSPARPSREGQQRSGPALHHHYHQVSIFGSQSSTSSFSPSRPGNVDGASSGGSSGSSSTKGTSTSKSSAGGGPVDSGVVARVASAFSNLPGNARASFRSLDKSNAGGLTVADFVAAAHTKLNLGNVPATDLETIFHTYNTSGSGTMALFEYVKFLGASSE